MTTNKTQAAKLLTSAEMELFSASLPATMKELSAARLAGKVKRARTLRDKFRDLLQRQAVATRGRTGTKAGISGSANERTSKKAEVFDEVLGRLSNQLEKVQAAQARQLARDTAAAAKLAQARARAAGRAGATQGPQTIKAAVKKAVASQKAAPGKSATKPKSKAPSTPVVGPAAGSAALGKGSQRARAAAKSTRLAAAGTKSVQAHIASAGKRTQAKRDKR